MAYPTHCLDNLVAFQGGCDPISPTSGRYLSQIGIGKDSIDQYITREYASPLDFVNERKSLAIGKICNLLHSSFNPRYRANSLLKNFRVGLANDNKVAVAGGVYEKGIHYEFCDTSSYYDLFISELSLFVDVTQDVTVNVWDLYQNKVIDTIVVPCVAGEISRVYPAKTYSSQQKKLSLFFSYDATSIGSYKTSLQAGGCTSCGGSDYISSTYNRIRTGYIPTGSSKTLQNFIGLSETGGMSINHSLQCNHEDWLCGISGLLDIVLLYAWGASIIEFALYESGNRRVNTDVTLNKDILKERLDVYELKWRESLDNIIKNVKVPFDNRCFVCNQNVRMVNFAI